MAESELQAWLNAAGKIKRVTPEQEIELGREVQQWMALEGPCEAEEQKSIAARGLRAKQRLCNANLRLVWRIVQHSYQRQVASHQLLDLLQVAAMGAFHAAGKFDPEAGYRFSTYCAWWVHSYCQAEIAKMGNLIRVPTTLTSKARRLPKVRHALEVKLGRPPREKELAEALLITEEELRLLLMRLQPAISLDMPVGDKNDLLVDLIPSPVTTTIPARYIANPARPMFSLWRKGWSASQPNLFDVDVIIPARRKNLRPKVTNRCVTSGQLLLMLWPDTA